MARPMEKVIGNEDIANSPNFSQKQGDYKPEAPSASELDDLDKALDASGVQDKPKEEVEADLARKQAGKPKIEQKTEPKEDEGRKIEEPKAEVKVEAKAEPKKELPKVEAIKPGTKEAPKEQAKQEDKDEEIDAIQEPRGQSPANSANWKKLNALAKRYKKSSTELEGKYKEAVTTINKLYEEKEKLPEPIAKELEEHRRFRKTFDYERDEEFQSKFVKPITDTEEEIYKILKDNELDEKSMAEIKKIGIGNGKKASWETIIKVLTESENQSERESGIMLRKLINQHAEKLVDKKQEIDRISKGQSEWENQRTEAQKKEMAQEVEMVRNKLTEMQKAYDFLRPVQAPADATEEQKKAVAEHNAFVKDLERQFAVSYRPANADQRFDTAMKAAYALVVDRELVKTLATVKQLQEQLAAANTELEGIKNATRMSSEGGETGRQKAKTPNSPEDYIGMKSEDAVEKAMQLAGL